MKKIVSLITLALSTFASHGMELPQAELNEQLIQAAADNDAEKITRLLTAGADVNADHHGVTPLHVAAAWNCKKTIKLLLAHNDIDVNAEDYKFRTPLHVAAYWNIPGAMKLLLAYNNINVNAEDYTGRTPLHVAIDKERKKAVQLLLAHNDVNVNAADYKDRTPLHVAIDKKYKKAVQLLLARNDINVNAADYKDRTPLHVASSGNYRKTVKLKLLLKHADINVNATNNDNETPLHCAARHNKQKNMQLLLKHTKKNGSLAECQALRKDTKSYFSLLPYDLLGMLCVYLPQYSISDKNAKDIANEYLNTENVIYATLGEREQTIKITEAPPNTIIAT